MNYTLFCMNGELKNVSFISRNHIFVPLGYSQIMFSDWRLYLAEKWMHYEYSGKSHNNCSLTLLFPHILGQRSYDYCHTTWSGWKSKIYFEANVCQVHFYTYVWYWNIKIKAGINFTNILKIFRKPWRHLHIWILYIGSYILRPLLD